MDYPAILAKGTRIRIGTRKVKKGYRDTAIGIEFILPENIKHFIDGHYVDQVVAEVLVNPKGFRAKYLSHTVDLEFDEIVHGSNSEVKSILEKYDD